MRKIKFRAWDDELNEMLYSKIEQFDDSLMFRFEKHFETENPIYMQYTGQKDRNGKEIYEGDIARTNRGSIGVIKFHDSWAAFYFSTTLALNEDGRLVQMTSAVPMWNDWASIEIIGNIYQGSIYQHSHLLKEATK